MSSSAPIKHHPTTSRTVKPSDLQQQNSNNKRSSSSSSSNSSIISAVSISSSLRLVAVASKVDNAVHLFVLSSSCQNNNNNNHTHHHERINFSINQFLQQQENEQRRDSRSTITTGGGLLLSAEHAHSTGNNKNVTNPKAISIPTGAVNTRNNIGHNNILDGDMTVLNRREKTQIFDAAGADDNSGNNAQQRRNSSNPAAAEGNENTKDNHKGNETTTVELTDDQLEQIVEQYYYYDEGEENDENSSIGSSHHEDRVLPELCVKKLVQKSLNQFHQEGEMSVVGGKLFTHNDHHHDHRNEVEIMNDDDQKLNSGAAATGEQQEENGSNAKTVDKELLTAKITALEFSPNERYLVSGASDGSIVVFDLALNKIALRIQHHHHQASTASNNAAMVLSLAFCPRSTSFVAGSRDGMARWYVISELLSSLAENENGNDNEENNCNPPHQVLNHAGMPINAVAFSSEIVLNHTEHHHISSFDENVAHGKLTSFLYRRHHLATASFSQAENCSTIRIFEYTSPSQFSLQSMVKLPAEANTVLSMSFNYFLDNHRSSRKSSNQQQPEQQQPEQQQPEQQQVNISDLKTTTLGTLSRTESKLQTTAGNNNNNLLQVPTQNSNNKIVNNNNNYNSNILPGASASASNRQQGGLSSYPSGRLPSSTNFNPATTTAPTAAATAGASLARSTTSASSSSTCAKTRLLLAVACKGDGAVRIIDLVNQQNYNNNISGEKQNNNGRTGGRILHVLRDNFGHSSTRVNHVAFFDARILIANHIIPSSSPSSSPTSGLFSSSPLCPQSPFTTNQGMSLISTLTMNHQTVNHQEVHDLLACSSSDGCVRLYDALHGKLLFTFGRTSEMNIRVHAKRMMISSSSPVHDMKRKAIGFNDLAQRMDIKQEKERRRANELKIAVAADKTTTSANESAEVLRLQSLGNNDQIISRQQKKEGTNVRDEESPIMRVSGHHQDDQQQRQQSSSDKNQNYNRRFSSPSIPTMNTRNNSHILQRNNNNNSNSNVVSNDTSQQFSPNILYSKFSSRQTNSSLLVDTNNAPSSSSTIHLMSIDAVGNISLHKYIEEAPSFPFLNVLQKLRTTMTSSSSSAVLSSFKHHRRPDSKLLAFTAQNHMMLQERKNRFLPNGQIITVSGPGGGQQQGSTPKRHNSVTTPTSAPSSPKSGGGVDNNNNNNPVQDGATLSPQTNVIGGKKFYENHAVPIRHWTMMTSLPGNRNRYEQVAPLRSGQYGAVCVVRKIGGAIGGGGANLINSASPPRIQLRSSLAKSNNNTNTVNNTNTIHSNNHFPVFPTGGGGDPNSSSGFSSQTTEPLYVQKTMSLNQATVVCTRSDADILANVAYPFIVQYYEQYEGFGNLNLIMEFVDGSDLQKKFENFTENYPKGHPALKAAVKFYQNQQLQQQNKPTSTESLSAFAATPVSSASPSNLSIGGQGSFFQTSININYNNNNIQLQRVPSLQSPLNNLSFQQQQGSPINNSQQSLSGANSVSTNNLSFQQQHQSPHQFLSSSFSKDEVISIFTQVAMAVDFLHRSNIAHRDIKPANILISRAEGIVKLTDFGFASRTDEVVLNDSRGTPKFTSPEIFLQLPHGKKADCFSMGVLLYVLLTSGRQYPFSGERVQELAKAILDDEPAPFDPELAPHLDRPLEYLVNKLLKKNWNKRMDMSSALKILETSYGAVSDAIRRYERLFGESSFYTNNDKASFSGYTSGFCNNNSSSMMSRHLTRDQHRYFVEALKKHKELIMSSSVSS